MVIYQFDWIKQNRGDSTFVLYLDVRVAKKHSADTVGVHFFLLMIDKETRVNFFNHTTFPRSLLKFIDRSALLAMKQKNFDFKMYFGETNVSGTYESYFNTTLTALEKEEHHFFTSVGSF